MRLKGKLPFISILAFIFILSISLSAQSGEWKLIFEAPRGIPSGWANQINFHPTKSNVVYAASEGGGFLVSNDEGKSWTQKNQGLTVAEEGTVSGLQVRCMALNPSKPETIYIGMAAFGVFKSTNEGSSWTDINGTLEDTFTKALLIHPSNPDTVYLGTDGGGMYRYDVKTDEWLEIIKGLKNTYIKAIVANPRDPKLLYIATDGGVSKTTNGGDSWILITNGITSRTVFCLAIATKDPKVLYAGTETGGLFKTIDGGEKWEAIGGQIWMAKPSEEDFGAPVDDSMANLTVTSVVVNPVNNSIVYASNQNGVFRSADAGATWAEINAGLTSKIIKSLAVTNTNPVKVHASTSNSKIFVYTEE